MLSTSSATLVQGVRAVFWGYRVKALDSFVMEDYCVMVTASNDGLIKMWKLRLKEVRLIIEAGFGVNQEVEMFSGVETSKVKEFQCLLGVFFFSSTKQLII